MPRVVAFLHPLMSERKILEVAEGLSVRQALDSIEGLKKNSSLFVVLNDDRLPEESFEATVLKDGDTLLVRVVPAGIPNPNSSGTESEGFWDALLIGGGTLIAGIGLATSLAFSWTGFGAVVGYGLMSVGGSMILSAWAETADTGDRSTERRKDVSGASNSAEQDGPVPIVFGKHLLTPSYWTTPHTSISGTDGEDKYVHMLFALGYADKTRSDGSVKVSDIKFGDSVVASNVGDRRNTVDAASQIDVTTGTVGTVEVSIHQGSASAKTYLDLLGVGKVIKEQNLNLPLERWRAEQGSTVGAKIFTGSVTADDEMDGSIGRRLQFTGVAGFWSGLEYGAGAVNISGFTNAAYNGSFGIGWFSGSRLMSSTASGKVTAETANITAYQGASSLTFAVDSTTRAITRNSGSFLSYDDDVKYGALQVGDFVTYSSPANSWTFPVSYVAPNGLSFKVSGSGTLVTEAATGLAQYTSSSSPVIETSKKTEDISVEIEFPSGLIGWAGGDRNPCTTTVKWYYRLKNSVPWIEGTAFSGSSSGVFTKQIPHTIRYTGTQTGLTSGQYEVRVQRETFDAQNSDRTDAVVWSALRSITGQDTIGLSDDDMKGVCFLAVKARASESLSGSIEKLNCVVEQVYRTYDGAGSAITDWAVNADETLSTNPAAAFLHALTGPINPRPITDTTKIDLAELGVLYAYCVTNAFQFNRVYTSDTTLRQMLTEILASCRSSLTLKDGLYSSVTDKAQTTIVQHISPRNSWGFSGAKSFEKMPHAYKIKFINAAENWAEDEMVVLDDGYKWDTDGDGILKDYAGTDRTADGAYTLASEFESLSVKDLGITDSATVKKFGRYLLACRRLRPETFTVNQDFESLVVTRGDLVRVSHDVPMWGLGQGRIKSVTYGSGGNVSSFIADELFQYTTGESYCVRIRTATGSEYATISNPGTSLSNTVTPVGVLTSAVESGQLVFFGETALESTEALVVATELNDDFSAKLTLVEYNAAVYTAEAGIGAHNSRITKNASLVPAPVVRAVVNTIERNYAQQSPGAQAVDMALTQGEGAGSIAVDKTAVWASLAVANATNNAVIGDEFLDDSTGPLLIYRCTVAAPSVTLENSVRIKAKQYGDVANSTELAALTGEIYGDTVYMTTTSQWYKYTTRWIVDGVSIGGTATTIVASNAPRYRGIGRLAATGTANFAGYEVSASTFVGGVITVNGTVTATTTITPNVNDWMLNYYNAGVSTLATFLWSGSAWTQTGVTGEMRSAALEDIFRLNCLATPIVITEGTTYIEAMIYRLFAKYVKILTGGSIRGGDRYDESGSTIDGTKSGFYISASGSCKVAGMEFEGSQGGGVQWGGPSLVGAELNIAGIGVLALAALNGTDVAFIDETNEDLRVYRWSGATWSMVGAELNIAGAGQPALAALNGTDVAFIDETNEDLRVYRWSGATWSMVGAELNIAGIGTPALTAINSTDVAFFDSTNADLRVYRWSGAAWSMVGAELHIAGAGGPALAALNETDVAFIDSFNESLCVYRWSGSAWSLVGSGFSIAGIGNCALTALNGTDVAFIDSNKDDLKVYRWSGVTWSAVTDAGKTGLGGGYPALCSLNGTDVAFIDTTNEDLRLYRFQFALSKPYSRTLTG